MKYEVHFTRQFKRDVKLAMRRGLPVGELDTAIALLATGIPLPERYRDHALSGDKAGWRDCHIRNDWVLLYCIDGARLLLTLLRTGTHSDLLDR